LAEKGFLPFEEAIGIYQHLNPQDLAEREHHRVKAIQEEPPDYPVPVSTSILIRDQDLFHMSLQQIKDTQFLQRLQMEFAAMCNQIISADALVVRDKEHLAAVVRKACGYLSIGLDSATGGDVQKAAHLVQEFPLAKIFRVGYGAALQLRWKTERWLERSWFVTQDFGLSFWADDWEGMLAGLLKKRPLLYTGFSGGEAYREFETLEEVMHCDRVLEEIMAFDRMLSLVLSRCTIVHPIIAYQAVSYKNIVFTSWARDHLDLNEDVEPLTLKELKSFFRDFWAQEGRPRRVAKRMKQALFDWLRMRGGEAVDEIFDQARKTIDNLLGEIQKESGSVSLKDLDPRYIKHFLVTR
jgi:hypothetical protein